MNYTINEVIDLYEAFGWKFFIECNIDGVKYQNVICKYAIKPDGSFYLIKYLEVANNVDFLLTYFYHKKFDIVIKKNDVDFNIMKLPKEEFFKEIMKYV